MAKLRSSRAEAGLAGGLDMAEPGIATELGIATPGIAAPGIVEVAIAVPGITAPGIVELAIAVPGIAETGIVAPGIAGPDTTVFAIAGLDTAVDVVSCGRPWSKPTQPDEAALLVIAPVLADSKGSLGQGSSEVSRSPKPGSGICARMGVVPAPRINSAVGDGDEERGGGGSRVGSVSPPAAGRTSSSSSGEMMALARPSAP
ncbi:hypothetical protein MRX96_002752 [Rhipicephalus microplus]